MKQKANNLLKSFTLIGICCLPLSVLAEKTASPSTPPASKPGKPAVSAKPAPSVIAIALTLEAEVSVSADQFTLGEVAQIEAPEAQKTILESIVLGASPRPGLRRQFNKSQLVTRLRQHKFDPKTITLSMPDTIYLKREAQTISADLLIGEARTALKARFPELSEQIALQTTLKPTAIKPGDFECKADPAAISRNGRLYTVLVTVAQENASTQTYRLVFKDERAPAATCIKSGDAIKVTTVSGSITLTVTGEARTQGAVGETITVYLPGTRKTVKAKILNEREAQLME